MLNHKAYEIREFVHRLTNLDQGLRALFVDPFHPASDRRRGHVERAGRLLERPASCDPQRQDGHSLGRRIVGPTVRIDPSEARILDPNLFAEQKKLLVRSVQFSF